MKKQSKRLFTLFLSLFFVLSDFQILSKAVQITDSNSDNAIYQQILDLYSTDGTLLATNDDSGYGFNAFITCDVDANVQYTIRIRFFSTNVYGTTKLAIFAAKKLQADVTQSLTRYEDFFCFKNTSNHTMNGYIEKTTV